MMTKEFEVFVDPDSGAIEVHVPSEEPSPGEQKEMKRISTKCGHVKRRLIRNEPLTGKVLEFALSVIEESRGQINDDSFLDSMSRKLTKGEELSDYESHILIDVLLLHKRLNAS